MSRMTREEGVRAYQEGAPSSYLLMYDPEQHQQEMQDLATGLIGALLELDLEWITGPDLGSPIPLVVTNVHGDLLRIFVDPYIDVYGHEVDVNLPRMKKAREHVELTALSYLGEPIYMDTAEFFYLNNERLAAVLQLIDKKFRTLRREVPSLRAHSSDGSTHSEQSDTASSSCLSS